MASQPDPTNVNPDADAEFERHFKAFAAGKPVPEEEAPKDAAKPEGNDPEERTPEAPADEAATKEEAPPESVTSGDQAKGAEEAPKAEAPDDPLAKLPDDARSIVEQLIKERDEARHKASSDASRVAALSRKLQSLTTAAPSADKAPAKAEESEAEKALNAKVEQLRKDYGDIAEPLIELIEKQRQGLTEVRTTLEGLSEERQTAVIAAETRALEERHPDWREVAADPTFAGWLEQQPENIQRLATSWDARETSVALTLFKTERAETTGHGKAEPAQVDPAKTEAAATTDTRRSQQLDGGRDVRSKPAPAASGPPEDFDAAFNYFVAKRQAAAKR
jgi:hypothetical protein